MFARHVTKLLEALPPRDAEAASAVVDRFITAMKAHLADESIRPLVKELLAPVLTGTNDLQELRASFIALIQPMRRIAEDDAAGALLLLIELRDPALARHHRAVEAIVRRLASTLDFDDRSTREALQASRVFDVGKLFVRSGVLLIGSHLDARERQHVDQSVALLSADPELTRLLPIVRAHHERFDGLGYPDRLARAQIPRAARVLAVADAWHSMLSSGAGRRAVTVGEALGRMSEDRGRRWDPSVVNALRGSVGNELRSDPARVQVSSSTFPGACIRVASALERELQPAVR